MEITLNGYANDNTAGIIFQNNYPDNEYWFSYYPGNFEDYLGVYDTGFTVARFIVKLKQWKP
jgi:hypothetical protein